MINLIKIFGIKCADLMNKFFDPWDDFTRLAIPAPKTLAEKAMLFEKDYLKRFYDSESQIFQYEIPWNMGDQALWHGVATIMWSERLKATQEYIWIRECREGLKDHQPDGYLIRGRLANQILADASNDSATGHLAGLVWSGAHDLAEIWARNIINHNYALINPNGKPTSYGQLEQGWKTDPLRLTLLLAILKFAGFDHHYRRLLNQYGSLVQYPKVRLLSWGKSYDTHRAALHLSILHDLDPTCPYYEQGLKRMLHEAERDGNIWVMLLCGRAGLQINKEVVLKVLGEFGVEQRLQGNREVVNSPDEKAWNTKGIKFKKWGNELQSTQPLPRWKCGSQDFYWQRNLRSIDNWKGHCQSDVWHSGLDYLVCYWMARNLGILK